MKATGIVRRIDDLGRVVIPKEIRRTMRIREGDPLEIFTNVDGQVVFKKYSPIGELSSFASQYAEVLCKAIGMPIAICDRDHVVTCAGALKKDCADRRISASLERVMEGRKTFISSADETLIPTDNPIIYAAAAAPIVAAGDVIGAVCAISSEEGATINESDLKLVQVAATFFGKQMEE